MRQVRAGLRTPSGARQRRHAVGRAYLDFARTESGLFDTAIVALEHHPLSAARIEPDSYPNLAAGCPPAPGRAELRPFAQLELALDGLAEAGLVAPARRPALGSPIWAAVHGLAVLLRGPLRALPDRDQARLDAHTFGLIEAALS
jgi:hypothetical protein